MPNGVESVIFNPFHRPIGREPRIKLTAHRLTAGLVFLVAMAAYIGTVAPTTSFWDCGEFIAASFTVGVPHPPGAPLFLLIGRLFSLLPTAHDIGMRVNIISSLVSAFTILLLYLCIVRLARIWRGEEKTTAERIAVYGGAAIGALSFAFSHSFWFNAVEAEVYALSMFFTALVFYLSLRWLDVADEPAGNRLLLFIFYLVGLSIGVHLLNILALMSVTLIVTYRKFDASFRTTIIAGLAGSLVILVIYPGIIQGIPLLIVKFSVWGVLLLLAVMVWGLRAALKKDKRTAAFALMAALLVVLGYSTFLIIKIRSGLNPFLDENDPETWRRLVSYLNREQYGTESLFLTMFKRKAPFWEYQIKKMYLRYLGWQFIDLPRLYGIPFLFGVIGAFHHFQRDSRRAFVVLALFFMTGLAVVFYLNQDDPQPRERDYAYVGSFFAFAVWIGLGVISLVESLPKKLTAAKSTGIVGGVVALCLVAAPLNMFAKNVHRHSRKGNYVAWDYSYNLLNTCAPNAILYTNGDNDTFPLWYLQEVAGVRKDVRVVNLSLLNTGWFIKQIRDKEPRVPMPSRITDDYIDNVIDSRDVQALLDRRWQKNRKVKIPGVGDSIPDLIWEVPATISYPIGGKTEYFLRVQDIMILNTMVANRWKRPIYFAVTVSDANLLGLRDIQNPDRNYLSMEGLAFRVYAKPVPLIDPEAMADNALRKYRYRNTDNPRVYYDNNILKLLGNYRQGLIQLAYHYATLAEQSGELNRPAAAQEAELASDSLQVRIERFSELSNRDKALTALEFMDRTLPEDVIPLTYDVISLQIGRLYSMLGRPDKMRERLDQVASNQALDDQTAYEYGARYLVDATDPFRAQELFEHSLQLNPSFSNHQRIAMTWLQTVGDTQRAADVLRRFLQLDDSRQERLRVAAQGMKFGLYGLAYSIYEPLLSENPNDGEAVRGLIDYYRRTGETGLALSTAEDWLERHPQDQAVRGTAEQLRGELKAAPGGSSGAR